MKKKILLAILMFIFGIYNVNALLEIPPNSYVLGEYLFTRDGSNEYDGVLTTQHLMMAAQSAWDNRLFYKRADGSYIDGLTGELLLYADEEYLLAEIKYYNLKEIPIIKSFYSKTATGYIFQNDVIATSYWDPDTYLAAGVEYYSFSDSKNARIFGTQEFYYPDEDGFESMGLNLLEPQATGMWGVQGVEVTFDSDISNYTVIGYPYVNVVDRVGKLQKIYLELDYDLNLHYIEEGFPYFYGNSKLYTSVASVRDDLTINGTFENNKLKINVTDQNTQKYKLIEVSLYRYFEDVSHEHFNLLDFANLVQADGGDMDYPMSVFYFIYRLKSFNGTYLEIVDKYEDFSIDPVYDNLLDEVELSDLGNREEVAGGKYLIYAQVVDEDGNIFKVASYLQEAGTNLVSQPADPGTSALFYRLTGI